jgi:hypothetical protein
MQKFGFRLAKYGYGATILMRSRIASPKMFLNAEPLPHVVCSRTTKERGGDDEAIEHGNAQGADVGFGPTL